MKVFLLAAVLLGLGILGMAVTMLVKKDGKFPDGEISHNKELRRRGIVCAKEEELRLWRKRNPAATAGSAPGASPDAQRPDFCPPGGCDACAFASKE